MEPPGVAKSSSEAVKTVLYLVTDHVLHTELMPLRATTEMSELFANRNDAYEHGCTYIYVTS